MIETTIKNVAVVFNTCAGIFSPDRVDQGTLAMLAAAEFAADDKVLDLGCGYGAVGITAAKIIGARQVFMSDINEAAVRLAKENATLNDVADVEIIVSDGFNNLRESGFTMILSNPPYHADFSVPKHFIEKGFNRLTLGGRMLMVTKRKDWYKNKLAAVFGGVKIDYTGGYYVFSAEKRSWRYAK